MGNLDFFQKSFITSTTDVNKNGTLKEIKWRNRKIKMINFSIRHWMWPSRLTPFTSPNRCTSPTSWNSTAEWWPSPIPSPWIWRPLACSARPRLKSGPSPRDWSTWTRASRWESDDSAWWRSSTRLSRGRLIRPCASRPSQRPRPRRWAIESFNLDPS